MIFPFGVHIPEIMAGLQEYIIKRIEKYSGIHIETLDICLDKIQKSPVGENEIAC